MCNPLTSNQVRQFFHQVEARDLAGGRVEVECDGVPPKNTYGINYRERFALCVPDNPKQLIEVLALRNGLKIQDSFGLQDGRTVRTMPNLLAGTAVFGFTR